MILVSGVTLSLRPLPEQRTWAGHLGAGTGGRHPLGADGHLDAPANVGGVHRVVVGARPDDVPAGARVGRRFFNVAFSRATMRPVDISVTEVGIVIGIYEPSGPVSDGQM